MREVRCYTQQQRDEAVQLLNNGHTSREVAEAMGVPQGTVDTWKRRWRERYGLVKKNKPKKKAKKECVKIKMCGSCVYRAREDDNNGCNYILIAGHMRGCDPIGCDKYVKGRRMKLKEE